MQATVCCPATACSLWDVLSDICAAGLPLLCLPPSSVCCVQSWLWWTSGQAERSWRCATVFKLLFRVTLRSSHDPALCMVLVQNARHDSPLQPCEYWSSPSTQGTTRYGAHMLAKCIPDTTMITSLVHACMNVIQETTRPFRRSQYQRRRLWRQLQSLLSCLPGMQMSDPRWQLQAGPD